MSWLSATVAPGAFRTRGSAGHTGRQASAAVPSRTRQAQQGFWKVHAEGSNRRKAPWKIGFDIRERETMWTDENKARLVRLMASRELKIPLEELERRMDELLTLVPDLALLENVDVIVLRLLALKEILPAANISALVAKHPDLLLQDPSWVAVQAERSRALLGVDAIDKIAEKEPRFLDAEGVQEALDELQLLMGKSTNVQELLVRDPSFLLKVERGEKRLGDAPDKGTSGDLMKDP